MKQHPELSHYNSLIPDLMTPVGYLKTSSVFYIYHNFVLMYTYCCCLRRWPKCELAHDNNGPIVKKLFSKLKLNFSDENDSKFNIFPNLRPKFKKSPSHLPRTFPIVPRVCPPMFLKAFIFDFFEFIFD